MTTVTTDSRRADASILLGSCAAIAVGIYVAATVLGGLLDPTYSHLSMHISELTSSHAPNRTLLASLYVGYLALVGVGIALRAQPHAGRWLTAASWLLVATGLVGILLVTWFPQDSYGYPATAAGTAHIALAGVAALTAIGAMLTAARGFTRETGWARLGRLSIVAAVAMLVAGLGGAIGTAIDSPYMGLLQRLSIAYSCSGSRPSPGTASSLADAALPKGVHSNREVLLRFKGSSQHRLVVKSVGGR
jgi:uncharacterized membrane protein YdcZ (DUF606 family)